MKLNNKYTRIAATMRIRSRRIGFVFSLLSIGLILIPTLPGSLGVTTPSKAKLANTGTNTPQCPACSNVGTQTIYAPLIELAESSGTEINLNCRSPRVMTVKPTFYTKKGEPVVGDAFQMQPAEVKTVNLKTLMPVKIRNRHDWGGMSLSYAGQPLEMWGQLRLLQVGNGGSVDITFANLTDKRSAVRDAVWSMPTQSSAVIAIGNAGTATIKAALRFSDGDSREVTVPSFGTEFIRRHGQPRKEEQGEAIRITSTDGSGLIVAGVVASDEGRVNSSIRFYDTQNVVQQNVYATNFRLHEVKARLVLRNTGTESIVATPRFRPVDGDPANFIDLASVNLRPNEIESIDLTSLSAGTQGREDFDTVSIEVLNSGPKGSLIGALNGVDANTRLTYDVPLRDSGGPRNSTGAYPWRLDGDVSTIVSITNVSPVGSQFVVQINYPGGPYLLDPQNLAAGATETFNLRKIRDQQIPDRNGHTIPRSTEGGQFRWFIHGGGHLLGRAEMLSVSRGISSSYSCNTPCPPRFDRGFVDPEPITVGEGEATGHDVLEVDVDSYSNEYGPFAASVVNSWSGDTGIATLDFGTVTGISVGSTYTSSTVEYPLYWWDGPNSDCTLFGTNETNVYGSVDVKAEVYISNVAANPTTVSSRVSGTSTVTVQVAASPSVGQGVTVTVQLVLESKSPTSIVPAATLNQANAESTSNVNVAVSPNSPGSCTFTVGSGNTNQTSGSMVYRAYITGVNSTAVEIGTTGANGLPVTLGVP